MSENAQRAIGRNKGAPVLGHDGVVVIVGKFDEKDTPKLVDVGHDGGGEGLLVRQFQLLNLMFISNLKELLDIGKFRRQAHEGRV